MLSWAAKSSREKMRLRIVEHNWALKNGYCGDPWVFDHRNKTNRKAREKYPLIPLNQRKHHSFPTGNTPHNKLITPEQKAESKEKAKKRMAAYYQRAKEKRKGYQSSVKERTNERARERRKTDPSFKLKGNLRKRLSFLFRKHLTNKSNRTMEALGCDMDFFKEYLKGKFTLGMNFDNYGEWHIDHIFPCSCFDFTNPIEVAKCFHYTNLQPLWAKDNLQKASKLNYKIA